jgi:hypothetical protein
LQNCLKSFDAKIVIGNGGHQDNVFEETCNFCEWVLNFGDKNDIYIVLIDTNLKIKFESIHR